MVRGSYQKDSRTEATVARFELNMVQLSLSPTLDVTPPPECSEEGEERQEKPVMADSPKVDSPDELDALQLNLVVSTTYHGYETYIEDGLICLKHKVRNLEKKKLKLEDYKKRLELGKALNKDQMAAVEKYEQVVHNLGFAQELHKTLDDLTQNLLRAQKKAVKREQVAKEEVEKRQLSMVLQVHYLLLSMQQEHVQRDLLAGHNQAPQISAQKLDNLNQLAVLLGVKRDNNLSLEEQMEQATLIYLDLLEGKDKPVVGSTFKMFKDELDGLLHCKYFTCLPIAPSKSPEMLKKSSRHMPDSKSEPTCISKENWKEFQAMKEPDLADCWDMALLDGHTSLKNALHKPWRGAATFIPKLPVTTRDSAGSKQRKARKAKGDQSAKLSHQVEMPVEIFNSPPTLPKDPILRKQHFEDFMAKIHSSFSFMQDSLLEGESSPTSGSRHKMQQSGSHSSLDDFEQLDRFVQSDLRNSSEILPKIIHSTPLLSGHLESKTGLPTGDQCLDTYELEISSKDLTNKHLQLVERKKFSSPPQYCKDPTTTINLDKSCPHTPVSESEKTCPSNGLATCNSSPSQTFSTPPTRRTLTSAQFQNIQSVFKASPSQSSNEDVNYKPDSGVFADSRYSSASTQTPPEFAPSEEEQLSAGNGGQIFLSPGQAGGNMGRPNQSYYSRGSVRGMARGGRGLAQAFRTSGWHRGGAYIHHGHPRDCGPVLNASRDSEHSYRRWGGWLNSNADWNDSTQVSSPGLMGTFTCVDSGHAEALSITMEIPLTPNGHHAAFLPMQLYPLFQPLRVAFSASRTANFAPGNLDQPIVFDHLHSNLGEMYDTHIGRFTCPANGMYVFMFHILKLAINIPLYINLMRNEEVVVSAYANDGAPDHETASNHTILHLFQGDQVWLRLHRGAIYGSTWNYSTFSGFLLHQD